MMRLIANRSRNVYIGSIFYHTRDGVVDGRCLAGGTTRKLGDMTCFPFDNNGGLSVYYSQKISQDCKGFHGSFHKQMMSLSYLISRRIHHAHSSIIVSHLYPKCHAHVVCFWQCRDLCTSQKPADSKHEVDCVDASWQTLASQMQDLEGGLAKGKALEALKGLVDQLEPFAEPTDLRLGLACLRLAQSLAAASEEPSKCLCYAQRALKCLETLQGSLEHASCLFIVGCSYFKMQKFDSAVLQLEQCISVLQQIKGERRDDCYSIALNVHDLLGKSESLLGNFDKSLVHYKHAIRIGKKSLKVESPILATLYYQAGMVCRHVAQPEIAMSFAQKALEAFMTCYGPSSLQVGKIRALMSGIHCDLEKNMDAITEYREAKPILEYLKEAEAVAIMNLDLAKLLMHQSKHFAALSFLEEVIKSTEVTSRFHVEALSYAANVYSELKSEVAADYCKRAVNALDDQETSHETGINMIRLGVFFEKRGEFDQAAVWFQKAMKMISACSEGKGEQLQLEDKVGLLGLQDKVGLLLLRTRKAKEAIPYFESSLKSNESGNGIQLFLAHYKLAVAYSADSQRLESTKHLKACAAMITEWLRFAILFRYYYFSIKNQTDNMVVLENVGICLLWFTI